jgi:hypothetical protein
LQRKGPGYGQPHHTGADDGAIEFVHTPSLACGMPTMKKVIGGRWRLRTSDPSSVNAVLYP